jgi:hypothetical protein
MLIAKYEYDEKLVCQHCNTNDKVHYNFYVPHWLGVALADPETAIWCNNCECETTMVEAINEEVRAG